MTTDQDPGPRKKGAERSPSGVEDKILLDLANALTALGNHLKPHSLERGAVEQGPFRSGARKITDAAWTRGLGITRTAESPPE